MTRTPFCLLCLYCLLCPPPSAAQDTLFVHGPGLAAQGGPAVSRAVSLFNEVTTRRFFGSDTIHSDETVRGDVGIYLGTLIVDGVVLGDLVAINASVVFGRNADIRGDVLVLGGTITESRSARLAGTLEQHGGEAGVRRIGNRLEATEVVRVRVVSTRRERFRFRTRRADADLVVRFPGPYNRVEGLPIGIGPRLQWGGVTRFDLEALGILRTAAGFSTENRELGYRVSSRLRIGWDPEFEIAGAFYDVVTPMETWKLGDDEIGLASFFLHRDYRDWYLTRGGWGRLAIRPGRDVEISGTLARHEATSAAARDPWTPFRNSDVWRFNPAVDEGTFTDLTTVIEYDARRERRWGGTGIYFRGEWLYGRADDGVRARPLPAAVRGPVPADWSYHRLTGDLRFYAPMGFGGLNLRALGQGVVGDGPLPVQHRMSLGGPEPLPGYPFRAFGCNGALADPAQPALCDRLLLFQAEFRGGFDIDLWDDWDWDWDWDRRTAHRTRDWFDWDWDFDGPHWVLFADAGTAWIRGNDPPALNWDVGAGLSFGGVGLYLARAIAEDEPVRFLFRLNARF